MVYSKPEWRKVGAAISAGTFRKRLKMDRLFFLFVSKFENVSLTAWRLPRKRIPFGLYRSPMLRVLGESYGGGRFFMGE